MASSLEKTHRSSSHNDFQVFSNLLYRAIGKENYQKAGKVDVETVKEFLSINGIRLLVTKDSQKKDLRAQNWFITHLEKIPSLITGELFVQASISKHIFSFLFNNHFADLKSDITENGCKNIKHCFQKILERDDRQQCQELLSKLKENAEHSNIKSSIEIGKGYLNSHVEKKPACAKKDLVNGHVTLEYSEIEVPVDDTIDEENPIDLSQKQDNLSFIENKIKQCVTNIRNDIESEKNREKIKNFIENNDFNINFLIDEQKNTLAHFVCSHLFMELMELLVKYPADFSVLNSKDEEPFDLLIQAFKEIAESQFDKGFDAGFAAAKEEIQKNEKTNNSKLQ